jgi:hypothetical protein
VIPGVKISMGGRDWIVPPLTLGMMRRLLPQIMRLHDCGAGSSTGSGDGEEIDVIIDLVTAAMQRNYPDMTPQQVEDLLDLGNARAVVAAILTGSGLRPVGEDEAPGVTRGQPAAMPNGVCADYTASSPPAADTRSPSSTR